MTDLIVDFPHQRNLRKVRFSETSQLHMYERHNVARQELWYTKAEYDLMALTRREDVLSLRVRVRAAAANSSREPGIDLTQESVCVMGIEHLLTPACIKGVRACRARCIRAVLTEQARQGPSPDLELGWEAIALASLAQTKQARLRARKLGAIHLMS